MVTTDKCLSVLHTQNKERAFDKLTTLDDNTTYTGKNKQNIY